MLLASFGRESYPALFVNILEMKDCLSEGKKMTTIS